MGWYQLLRKESSTDYKELSKDNRLYYVHTRHTLRTYTNKRDALRSYKKIII